MFSPDSTLEQYYSAALVTLETPNMPSTSPSSQPNGTDIDRHGEACTAPSAAASAESNGCDAGGKKSVSSWKSDASSLPLLAGEAQQLKECMEACSSLTAKEDMLQTLRYYCFFSSICMSVASILRVTSHCLSKFVQTVESVSLGHCLFSQAWLYMI